MSFEAGAASKTKNILVSLALASIALLSFSMFLLPSHTSAALSSSSIIINEVLYDPEGSDSGNEWIELKNVADYPINFVGWSIQVAGTFFTTKVDLPFFTIQPDELVLIGESNVPNADIITRLSMQNGGAETDGVRLVNQNNSVIDTLLYDAPNTNKLRDDLAQENGEYALDIPSGHSLARFSSIDTNSSLTDFRECDQPTPGEKNLFSPTASISTPENTFINKPLHIDGSESSDLDGTITLWDWTLLYNDESLKELTGETITFTPDMEGLYTIQLTVTDNDNQTNTTDLELEVTQDPDNPTITKISDAKTLDPSTRITIKATITSPTGIPSEHEAYAQDKSGGIRLKVPDDINLEFSMTYTISGTLDTTYGEKRLRVDEVLSDGTPGNITPKIIKPTGVSPELLGQLVTIEFQISQKRNHYFYGQEVKDHYTPIIYIPDELDITFPSKTKDTYIYATGIVSQYGTDTDGNPKIKIIPRFEDEITFSATPQTLAYTGTQYLYLATLLLPSLVLVYTIRRIYS